MFQTLFPSQSQGGRDAYTGGLPGFGSGEGPSSGAVAMHTVRIHNPAAGQEVEVEVPEDRCIRCCTLLRNAVADEDVDAATLVIWCQWDDIRGGKLPAPAPSQMLFDLEA